MKAPCPKQKSGVPSAVITRPTGGWSRQEPPMSPKLGYIVARNVTTLGGSIDLALNM